MKLQKQNYNNVTVLELNGELDLESADMLETYIYDTISTGIKGIVLDMRKSGFIDSAGLEKLLWARDYCDENRCQFRLAGLDENCRKILEITRLEDEFDRYGDLAEAVKSFA